MTWRVTGAERKKRDRAIVRAYRESRRMVSQREIAERFGVAPSQVSKILGEHDARDPERNAALHRERWQRGHYADVEFNQGRKPVWPDCPPELEPDYRTLRKAGYRAADARRVLEGAA